MATKTILIKGLIILAFIFIMPTQLINQNQVNKSVLGNGGTNTSNTGYGLKATVGQPIIGSVSNSTRISNQGFWYLAGINITDPVVTISEDADADSVTATYIANVISDGGSPILERGILISLEPNPTLSSFLQKQTAIADTGEFTIVFRNLTNSSRYYARAYATNVKGTAYSPSQDVLIHDLDGISFDMEKGVPGGDGNGDGIPDYAQNNVVSFTSIFPQHGHITMAIDDGLEFIDVVNTKQIERISNYYYPYGVTSFRINADSAAVKIFFQDVSELKNFTYRKSYDNSEWFDYPNAVFGSEVVNGRIVATVTIMLYDGGLGDADGVKNGTIFDPGGLAISFNQMNTSPLLFGQTFRFLLNSPIPTFSEWVRIIALCGFLIVGGWWIRKLVA